MEILVLKEAKNRKPDLISCAVSEAFSNGSDIVNITSIKIESIEKTTTSIKGLIKEYKPDIVVAQKMLASIVLFELPKSIKKILIDPWLIFEDSGDDMKLMMLFKYSRVRIFNWLNNASIKFVKNPSCVGLDNTFCIVRNFMNNFARYDSLVTAYTTNGKKNFFMGIEDSADPIQNISAYHRVLNKARQYFDPDFELPNENELIES